MRRRIRVQALEADRSEEQLRFGRRLVFGRIMEAYGRMLLQTGLFQADVHPGKPGQSALPHDVS